MPEIPTKSRSDAHARVLLARMGSLADRPSVVYLEALKREILAWSESVDEELAKAYERASPSVYP